MPGARCARSRVWCVESTRVSHHGHTGETRHSPRNGFTAYIALSPVIGLFCHRHRRKSFFRQLDAGVEASGPHDFAVRFRAFRLAAPKRPPHPALHVRDDRETPLERARDGGDIGLIWVKRKAEYFFEKDWTGQIRLKALAYLSFWRMLQVVGESTSGHHPRFRIFLTLACGQRSPCGSTRARVPSSQLTSACVATSSLISNSRSSVVGSHVNVRSISPGKICQVEPSSSVTR